LIRIKTAVFHLFGIFTMLLVLGSTGLFFAIKKYHSNAHEFWGSQFKPDESSPQLFQEFPLSVIIPEGGPLASPQFFNVCSETQFPLVPVRQIGADQFEALCGFGSETRIEPYRIEDEQLKEMLSKKWNEDKK
jgi:hypothetical protein